MAKEYFPLCLSLALSLAMFRLHMIEAKVPTVFILGDSTADVGTNTYLPGSTARADFPFNGIDFPYSKPTGRFSNGLNSADFLAKLLGFRRSPPSFLSLLNQTGAVDYYITRGINFASGGSGILSSTGQREKVITMEAQIEQLTLVKKKLAARLGEAAAAELLSKSIFFISVGSNDLFAYYAKNGTESKEEFICNLRIAYETQLKSLIDLGARKFGIISVAPIGCCPSQRAQNITGGCLEELNDLSKAFYSTINSTLQKLSSDCKGFKYSLGNAFEMTINVINNPNPFGFKDAKTACCGEGTFNGMAFCTPKANLCTDRNEYLFWDLFHPTQAASELAAKTLYGGGPQFTTPINFSQLVSEN